MKVRVAVIVFDSAVLNEIQAKSYRVIRAVVGTPGYDNVQNAALPENNQRTYELPEENLGCLKHKPRTGRIVTEKKKWVLYHNVKHRGQCLNPTEFAISRIKPGSRAQIIIPAVRLAVHLKLYYIFELIEIQLIAGEAYYG